MNDYLRSYMGSMGLLYAIRWTQIQKPNQIQFPRENEILWRGGQGQGQGVKEFSPINHGRCHCRYCIVLLNARANLCRE